MKRWPFVVSILIASLLVVSARPALAQYGFSPRPGSSYGSFGRGLGRPRVSPWMNLYRGEAGPIDNYHGFVRPEMRLRDTLRRQQMGMRRQAAAIGSLGAEFARSRTATGVRPTGTGSVFMNYSHYYQFRSPARRR